jgi:hypothetical protein
VLGRSHEVALVLAVLIIDDDDDAALAYRLNGFFDCGKLFGHVIFVWARGTAEANVPGMYIGAFDSSRTTDRAMDTNGGG